MITYTSKDARVLWQSCLEDEVPEPPIVINPYMNMITLEQEGNTINLNYESIKELSNNLKLLKRPD